MRAISGNRKIIRVIFSVILLAALLFFAGRYIIYTKIERFLQSRLENLAKEGIVVDYDHTLVNPWKGNIEVYQLNINFQKDSLDPLFRANIPYLYVKGINIFDFIAKQTLSIDVVSLWQPSVTYSPNRARLDDNLEKSKHALENIAVGQVNLIELALFIKDSLSHDTIFTIHANAELKEVGLERRRDSLVWNDATVGISDFFLDAPKHLYACTSRYIHISVSDKIIDVDSLVIRPTVSKEIFMKSYGKEIDYISGMIPYIKMRGVNFFSHPARGLEIDKVILQFKLEAFRDKRYPFRKYSSTVLPSHYLQRLPWKIKVDSIRVEDSYVLYEEFPENGDASGSVYFDKLYATIVSVHNDVSDGRNTLMTVYAKLMGSGDLNIRFSFPGDTTKPYRVRGTLKNFSLPSLNRMLIPHAKARIESGIMTNLKFSFLYTMYRSDGEVELNYQNLNISSLRETKKNEQVVSFIKTLLLNTFIFKKDMDEDVEDDEKTGVILFHRDSKRSVFNYWWKSVFSGIKSAYKLDVLQSSKVKGRRSSPQK